NTIDEKLHTNSGQNVPDFGWRAPSGFPRDLVAAIEQNRVGNAARALGLARAAETAARLQANSEHLLWAKFEQVYALQRLSQARTCLAKAKSALAHQVRTEMLELRVALLTEAGICSEILGDFAAAERFYLRGKAEARSAESPSWGIRIAGMRAARYNSEGRHSESERLDIEALSREDLNPMRRYQFLSDVYFNAVAQRYFFAAYECESEAEPYAA